MISLEQLASEKRLEELEESFLEALSNGFPSTDMFNALSILVEYGNIDLAENLVELIIDAIPSISDSIHNEFIKKISSLFHRFELLKNLLVEVLRDEFLTCSPLEYFLRKSGLLVKNTDLSVSWNRMKELLRYREGGFIYHQAFGTGQIKRLKRGSLTADFQLEKDHDMSIEAAVETTSPVSPDSLYVMKWKNPEGLYVLFKNRPEKLLSDLFRQFGNELHKWQVASILKGSDLKDSEVWKTLKKIAQASNEYEDYGDSITQVNSQDFQARADILLKSRISVREKNMRLGVLLSSIGKEEKQKIREKILTNLSGQSSAETGALFEMAWSATDEGRDSRFSEFAELYLESSPPGVIRALTEISSPSCRKSYLEYLSRSSQWSDLYLHLIRKLPRQNWLYVLKILQDSNPSLVTGAMKTLISNPGDTEFYLRAVEICVLEAIPGCLKDDIHTVDMILKAFPFAKADTQKRITSLLLEKLVTSLKDYLKNLDSRKLEQLVDSLDKSGPAHDAGLLLIAKRELSGRRLGTPSSARFWESDAIYDCPAAIRKRISQLDHILKKEIPAAAADIAEAASHGDLSENAEYTAALEKRDFLLARAKQWQDDLAKTKPYPKGEISDRVVSPGTRVVLSLKPDGKMLSFSLVGPLSADAENDRINYLAPMGTQLLGKFPGDSIMLAQYTEREYVLDKIEVLPEVGSK